VWTVNTTVYLHTIAAPSRAGLECHNHVHGPTRVHTKTHLHNHCCGEDKHGDILFVGACLRYVANSTPASVFGGEAAFHRAPIRQ